MIILFRCICSIGLFLTLTSRVHAIETKFYFWITFSDKPQGQMPSLSESTLKRRALQGIPITVADLPVNKDYIQIVEGQTCEKIVGCSRWLNAVCLKLDSVSLEAIRNLSIVKHIQPLGDYKTIPAQFSSVPDYGQASGQLTQIGIPCLHQAGFTGKNIKMGIFDSGFRNVNINNAFDSLRSQQRLAYAYDFVNGDTDIYNEDSHGADVLSTMAAWRPGVLMGAAYEANYSLLRTETVATESPLEEVYWQQAMEWADSAGIQIIQSSLGYTTFSGGSGYTYADLNGHTAVITQAAQKAAEVGMLVVVSAGNEGSGSWGYITVPADADSILAVGAVSNAGLLAGFSSRGPTADGRIKPDLVATGLNAYIINSSGGLSASSGTSFAAPLIAGLSACLWQAYPQATAQQVRKALLQSSNRFQNPDNYFGHGIPDGCQALNILQTIVSKESDLQTSSLKLWPIPAQQEINLLLPDSIIKPIYWQLTDLQGKQINSGYANPLINNTIDLVSLNNGIYLLTFNLPEKSLTRIIEIQK